jgi:hypothetical protein
MSEARENRPLFGRPKVGELREAGPGDKVLAVAGVLAALVMALILFWLSHRSGALAGGTDGSGPPQIPALNRAGGVVMLLVGAVLLVLGWPLYRLTVILMGLSIGSAVAGGLGWLAGGETGAFIAALSGGLAGSLAAWPTEVFLRTLCGALAGLAAGLAVVSWLGGAAAMAGCGVGGLLMGGGLTFLLYRSVVMFFSAMLGAVIAVYGGISAWQPGAPVEVRPGYAGAAIGLALLGFVAQKAIDKAVKKKRD